MDTNNSSDSINDQPKDNNFTIIWNFVKKFIKLTIEWSCTVLGILMILYFISTNGSLFSFLVLIIGTLIILPLNRIVMTGNFNFLSKSRYRLPIFLIMFLIGMIYQASSENKKNTEKSDSVTQEETQLSVDDKLKKAQTLITEKKYNEAKIVLEDILTSSPDNKQALLYLNNISVSEKKESEVLLRNENLKKLTDSIQQANLHIKEKKWEECLTALGEVKNIFPKDQRIINLNTLCSKENEKLVKKESEDFEQTMKSFIFIFGVAGTIILIRGLKTKCPNCNKWFKRKKLSEEFLGTTYKYKTKDGQKDLRYKNNTETSWYSMHYNCKACNHKWSEKVSV